MAFESGKKRNRQVLVCNNCHKKKIKCDRRLPCSSCIKLSIDSTCSYSAPTYKKPTIDQVSKPSGTSSEDSTYSAKLNLAATNQILLQKVDILNERIRALENTISESASPTNDPTKAIPSNSVTSLVDSANDSEELFNQNFLKKLAESEENIQLIGINPNCSKDYIVNFLDVLYEDPVKNEKFVLHGLGPLSSFTLARGDAGSRLLAKYLSSPSSIKPPLYSIYARNSYLPKDTIESLDKKSREYYGAKYIKRLGKSYNSSDVIATKNSISQFGLNVGVTFYSGHFLQGEPLIEQVKAVLPNMRNLRLLIRIYFDSIYTTFPILDETSFKSNLNKILKIDFDDDTNHEFKDIYLENKFDLATVAILMIVIRLSYLSLLSNDLKEDRSSSNGKHISDTSDEKNILLKHPVPFDVIDIAEFCLKELDLSIDINLTVLQALTFMHIYRFLAPEEDLFSRHDPRVSFGRLYQIANAISLNRDPEYLLCWWSDERNDTKTNHLRRKLWYILIIMDVENSIVYGTPILTIDSNYDTTFPYYKPNCANILDEKVEEQLISALKELQPVVKSAHTILEMIFRVKSDMKLSSLIQYLTDFEILVKSALGDMNDYLIYNSNASTALKLLKFRLYLYCKLLLSYTFYCLHLFFEHKEDMRLSSFYLKKLCAIMFYEMAGIMSGLLGECEKYFGSASSLILRPILHVCNRLQMNICSIRIRLICTLRSLPNYSTETNYPYATNPVINSINSISENVRFIEERGISFMERMSKRYHFAWKYNKIYRYGQSIVLEDDLYSSHKEDAKLAVLKFPLDELNSLDNLLKACRKKIETMKQFYLFSGSSCDISNVNGNASEIQNNDGYEIDLMERVQIDKMWHQLEIFKNEWNKNQFSRVVSGIHSGSGSFITPNGDATSQDSEYSNDLLMLDFDLLRDFIADDIFTNQH